MTCAILESPDAIVLSVDGVRATALYLIAALMVALYVAIETTVTRDPGPPPKGKK